jgi:hypothetical protein
MAGGLPGGPPQTFMPLIDHY